MRMHQLSRSRVFCAAVLAALAAAAPAQSQTLFFDDFAGPLGPAYSTALPGFLGRTYLGASGYSLQTLGGASVIRLQNVMGNASIRGWSSSSIYPSTGSIRLEARFNTMEQSPTTGIDELMGLWILDPANPNRFDYITLAAPGWGTGRYLYAYSGFVGNWLQTSPLNWNNNTWYRVVITGSPTQNVRLSIYDDTGTLELAGVDTGHSLAAFPSGFKFGLSQCMGLPGSPYPTDAAVDWLRLSRAVTDLPPVATSLTVAPNPGPVGTLFALTATITDAATGGSNIISAEYNIDGGPYFPMNPSDGSFDSSVENVQTSVAMVNVGVYNICVRGRDAGGGISEPVCTLAVAYDPNAGSVTGGGWILSPPGAYAPDPSLTGKANFGFVAKYLPGAQAPSGDTQFQFQVARLSFKSTNYDWLVVAGARAQFKGSGTINGAGDYRFLLTAIDGQAGGRGGLDRFRIKIWDGQGGGIVYDNQAGEPDSGDATTELGGGSIVVHK